MEKQSSKRKDPKTTSPPQKFFGTNKLQISENDASRIIGSIVEKGISNEPQSKTFAPTPAPKPTVLPFPVARHRSHGPHWGPIGSKKDDDDDKDDDMDDEDNDFAEYDPRVAFANPIQRKQKTDLDFSRWRELVSSDNSSVANKREENMLRVGEAEKERKDGEAVRIEDKKIMSSNSSIAHSDAFASMDIDVDPHSNSYASLTKTRETMRSDKDGGFLSSVADMELENSHKLRLPEVVNDASSINLNGEPGSTSINSQDSVKGTSYNDDAKSRFEKMEMNPALPEALKKQEQKSSTIVSTSTKSNFANKQGSTSLESDIDAENRAQLLRMSADEISQAQAEIMEKLDPALLKLLKKRGQEKLKKQKGSSSDLVAISEPSNAQNENHSIQDAKGSPHFESDISDTANIDTSKDTQSGLDSGEAQNLGPSSSTLWSAWSERVEAVRELRFFLDGTVIANDFVQIPETGDVSVQNRHNAENVTAHDFLRTEGDPGAAGYTIKEAVELTRSVVPGQRALALHLVASVLDKAVRNINQNQVGCTMRNDNKVDRSIDWEAIWAFALGPEPELVLSLRICLDDNHDSVVLACAKVIQCMLSCELNENFFDILEKISFYVRDIYTAPVFRSKPEIDVGFLHGGFWKYNAKPSNILLFDGEILDSETEGKHTIQDDVVFAGQDVAAGLVRMGILPRIRYLLETEPNAPLEECLISVLIAIARHSPTCANAIMKCQRLVQTVVHRFTMNSNVEVRPSKIKSVCLLKVLARSDKNNCMEFIKNGHFQAMTWQLYQHASSLEPWVKLGKENCRLSSALMVKQLRFWKVCIQNGCCISYFSDIFPALCLWLNPPTFEKLIENNVLSEFASISKEAYLVLEALARTLPNFYSQKLLSDQIPDCPGNDREAWSWSYVGPMVDLAVKWISLKPKLFERKNETQNDFVFKDMSATPFLWVYSAVMHMLSRVLERVIPDDTISLHESSKHVPWLPEFVPKIGLEIIKNKFFSFLGAKNIEYGAEFAGCSSFVEELCCLRRQSEYERSLVSVCCLHGLVQVIVSIDNLIRLAKAGMCSPPSQGHSFSIEGNILESGILKGSLVELRCVLNIFMKLVATEWHFVQSIEMFGRGGPAPGVGLGWGASGGGFWSMTVLLAQTDAGLLIQLLELFQVMSVTESLTDEEMTFTMQRINSALGICLTLGPRDGVIMEKAFNIMLQVPVLKYLELCIRHFLLLKQRTKLFGWEYKEEDYIILSKILASHFRNRWLCVKRKLKAKDENNCSGNKASKKGGVSLDTIHEDVDTSNMTIQDNYCTSLIVEWAHQRLPLPMHWFLSPISTTCVSKHAGLRSASNVLNLVQHPSDVAEVAKGGLFLLLGIEAMSSFLSTDVPSPVQSVPLIWKLHSLSMTLLIGMGMLEEVRSRDVYESLQEFYGQLLDEARSKRSAELVLDKCVNLVPETGKKDNLEFLRFQSEIHESYLTFIETLVEQYAAISYGDLIYGRQVAVYLHRCVEAPVRLAAWNALSSARVLELLPPLHKCFAEAEGYLEPVEDNEGILEAYVKSWISGSLDRAATRGSVAFTLVLHHLSTFIFVLHASDKLSVQNKLVKSLLRDYSRKQQHEGMMLDFIRYNKPSTFPMPEQKEGSSMPRSNIEERFEVLIGACEGNSSLLSIVEKLKSSFVNKHLVVN